MNGLKLTLSSQKEGIKRQFRGFDAYDNWHFLVRTKEVINLKNLLFKKNKKLFSDIPRKDKFLFLFFSILACKQKNILELGSSSCEFVDGINFLKKIYKKNIKFNYFGFDNSKIMNEAAYYLHPKDNLKIFDNFQKITQLKLKNFFLHDYAVSNYIFKSTKKYANFMNRFYGGYSQILFSKNKFFRPLMPSGKKHSFFSIDDFKKNYKYNAYFLFPTKKIKKWSALQYAKNNPYISGYFFFSRNSRDIDDLKRYIFSDRLISNYCKSIDLKIKNIKDL